VASGQESARFDLAIWVIEEAEGIRVLWIYSKDLFEESTVIRMHDHYATLLSNIVDRPEARLTTLDISPQVEAAAELNNQRPARTGDPIPIKRRGINISTSSLRDEE
jgi:non-ribosomal peptide synthetase component F